MDEKQTPVVAPAPKRTFTDADTRLFAVRGQLTRFAPTQRFGLQVENPVPMLDAEGKTIGSANVYPMDDGTVVADGLGQYGCPERLSLETGARLYFHAEMSQHFLYLDAEGFEKVGVRDVVFPAGKQRLPFIVLVVGKVVLTQEPRQDVNVDPVVLLGDDDPGIV